MIDLHQHWLLISDYTPFCLQLLSFYDFPFQVGADEFGYMLANILKENNVDNSGMCFDSHARTALAFVTLRSDGEREFMFYRNPSADMLLTEKELNIDLINKVKRTLPFILFDKRY